MRSESAHHEKYLLGFFIGFLLLGGLTIISPFSVGKDRTFSILLLISSSALFYPFLLLVLLLIFWQIQSEYINRKKIAMLIMVLVIAVSGCSSCLQFAMPFSILDNEIDGSRMYLLTYENRWDFGRNLLYDCEWMMICNSVNIPNQSELGAPRKISLENDRNLIYVLNKNNEVIYEYQP